MIDYHLYKKIQPQPAGRGVVVHDDKILLVRGDGDGSFWTLPGGRCDFNEDIKSCVAREVHEETGIIVEVGDLFAIAEYVHVSADFHITQFLFFADIKNGELNDNWIDEHGPVEEARFFSVEETKDLDAVYPLFIKKGEWISKKPLVPVYQGIKRRD